MKRIGMYGGTFSPPHNGHIHAALSFISELSLDRLYIVPAGIPPHKSADGVSAGLRLAMTSAAFERVSDKIEVIDYEIRKTTPSYTAETLEYLSDSDAEMYLLCGTDMFLSLESWHRFRDIFAVCTVAVIERGFEHEATAAAAVRYGELYRAKTVVLSARPYELSSTEIRGLLKSGGDISACVPPDVLKIIVENGIYK